MQDSKEEEEGKRQELYPGHYIAIRSDLSDMKEILEATLQGIEMAESTEESVGTQFIRPMLWFLIPTLFASIAGAEPLHSVVFGIVPMLMINLCTVALTWMGVWWNEDTMKGIARLAESIDKITEMLDNDSSNEKG